MTPKISVIVPVYNVEAYLRQCLESIRAQTLREIEIICVDDGSTDGSVAIIKELATSDDRLMLIEQKNSGAGTARNKGLAIARGEYLSFLDSDDFFEPKMLEKAYARGKEMRAEIVCFRADRYHETDGHYERTPWTLKREQLPNKDVFRAIEIRPNIYRSMIGWAWDKLFSRTFIIKENLLFQEIRIHNDMYFVYSALVSAQRITILDEVFVHQRKRISGSLSNEDVKTTALECVRDSLMLTRGRLQSIGLDRIYGRDFINYTLSLFLHHLDTTCGNAREVLYNLIHSEWLNLFAFDSYNADYFYSRYEYSMYLYMKYLPYDRYLIEEDLRRKVDAQENALKKAQSEVVRLKKELSESITYGKQVKVLQDEVNAVRKSCSYRLGSFLLIMPSAIKRRIGRKNKR